MKTFFIYIIGLYRRYISPLLPPACRFTPTCSEYARAAIVQHGVVRGGAMAVWRLARCHPLGGHGHDPVPVRADNAAKT